MAIESILGALIIGAIAGWLAGKLMKRGGFGLTGNVVVGIAGAVIGQYVFGLLGIVASSVIGTIVMATVGAAMLLFVVGLIRK
jgi:uncharacterized membrane protein YeaQ/YmgE (transglycosylase-associated protein family)